MWNFYRKIIITLFLLGTVVSGGLYASETVKPEPIPYDEIRRFTDAFAEIKANYVEEVSDDVLLENAIRGMLDGLDPHSSYLNKDDFADLQESTSGEFGGLGIEVTMENGFVKVVSPIDDTPAFHLRRPSVRLSNMARMGEPGLWTSPM